MCVYRNSGALSERSQNVNPKSELIAAANRVQSASRLRILVIEEQCHSALQDRSEAFDLQGSDSFLSHSEAVDSRPISSEPTGHESTLNTSGLTVPTILYERSNESESSQSLLASFFARSLNSFS